MCVAAQVTAAGDGCVRVPMAAVPRGSEVCGGAAVGVDVAGCAPAVCLAADGGGAVAGRGAGGQGT